MTDIIVTDSMVEAALRRLNRLRGGEVDPDGMVAMHWGDVLREAYIAMEKQRRQEVAERLLQTAHMRSGELQ